VNSPTVKAFGDERIAAGETCLVVDLGDCTGMDSTFMGTLAGMAARLSALKGGVLQIAKPGERNRRSLEDLGLDFLMEIDPPAASWRGKMASIRSMLKPPQAAAAPGQIQRTRHVLDAHQALIEINDQNAREFKQVVTLLENELARKEELAENDEPR
jgi:anti-anti-sigma regulatory factor